MGDSRLSSRPDWVREAVFYHIFPDRFCRAGSPSAGGTLQPWDSLSGRDSFYGGNLAGIRSKLDYLQDLGINALLLTPIFRARTPHRYDTCSYMEVDPMLGTEEDLRALVDDLHGRGMRLVLDGVFNHTGTGFHAFQDLLAQGEQSAYRDWYFVGHFPIDVEPPSYRTCGGAAFLPKLNTGNQDVQDHLLYAARFWLEEFGVDGWRMDSACKVPQRFWRKVRTALKHDFPESFLLGEIWGSTRPWSDGSTFDGVSHYRLRDLILKYTFKGVDSEDVAFDLEQLVVDAGEASPWMLTSLGSHDTPRLWREAGGDLARLKIALILQMTLPGVPAVYYGDEIGLDGGEDPDNRRAMPWAAEMWNQEVLALHRRLIKLRRDQPALTHGTLEMVGARDHLLIYRRCFEAQQLLVVLNTGEQPCRAALPAGTGDVTEVFSGERIPSTQDEMTLTIPAMTAYVYCSEYRPKKDN
ncbi:MAG: alpha-glucosidase C-terminal domain-containing protein [Anaerolineales bacterium]|nr:alpha-glucosidase C-terminal domain-containing protein [Anaerolineales bacterium]